MRLFTLNENKKIALSALGLFILSFILMMIFLDVERLVDEGQTSVLNVKEVIEEHMGEGH